MPKLLEDYSNNDELHKLYMQWRQSPTKALNTQIIEKLRPVITGALRTYGYSDDPLIKTEAELYTIDALKRYDPTKGTALPTFITNELQRLPRIAAKQQFPIPIPEQALLDYKHIKSVQNELYDKLGREPTVDELADATKLSPKRINTLMKTYALPIKPQGLMDDAAVSTGVQQNETLLAAVYEDLDPINKKIFEWTLGWNGQPRKSKKEIAQLLNISPAAVTQRSQTIARYIDQFTEMLQ